jgi:PAP2 superfamily
MSAPRLPPDRPYPAAATAALQWHQALWQRMRHLFWLKLLGVSAFMWVFFVGYFHTLRHPIRPVQEMPLTALDQAISVQPLMLGAYVSLWLYVGIAPGLLSGLRELAIFGLWAAALCLTGLAIFYVYPTAVPKPLLPVDVAQHPGFVLLQGVDAAGNACPSLHVATALFTALWVQRHFARLAAPRWLRVANVLWVCLIVYSTLAIKQHVVLDALAGAALGAVFGWASMRWFPQTQAAPAGGGR